MKKPVLIWITLIVLLAASLACVTPFRATIVKGSGNVVSEEREVSDFEKVTVTGAGKLIITQGDEESLTIETDDNLMQYIESKVSGRTLELGFTDNVSFSKDGGRILLEPSGSFIFRVGVIDLSEFNITGAASFETQELDTEQFKIVLSGAGDINIDSLTATTLVVTVSGAGDVDVAGKVETQEIVMSGLGRYNAADLESEEATVSISGAGGADVWANDTLDVTISGAGDVDYYGSPTLTKEINGLGSINHQGDK
jgi:hypothetical protein